MFQDLAENCVQPEQLYLYRDFEAISSAAFYAGGPVKIIDCRSNDLLFGMTKEANVPHLVTVEAFRAEPGGGRWVIVRKNALETFNRAFGDMRFSVRGEYGGNLLLGEE